MASRNYYLVLGVASNESDRGVRAAFRELARRYHPDRAGPSGNAPFREVVEAYETLGDPRRRDEYDASLRRSAEPAPHSLVRNVSLRRDFTEIRPREEALFDRFARNFTGTAPRGESVEQLTLEVAVSEEEAGRGTRVRLGIPVFARCPECAGRGCDACRWQGIVEGERPVTIGIPPMSGRGTTFVMPLTGLGIHNFFVRVRVRVEPALEPGL